ncbi:MAG: hypothetical protein AMS22_06335 [Thiotrichales bacterium SG8_50]|nr:MAG: hypothetical protein AMS22_06335 [Thiotrichales bacterium SG8_50]
MKLLCCAILSVLCSTVAIGFTLGVIYSLYLFDQWANSLPIFQQYLLGTGIGGGIGAVILTALFYAALPK